MIGEIGGGRLSSCRNTRGSRKYGEVCLRNCEVAVWRLLGMGIVGRGR